MIGSFNKTLISLFGKIVQCLLACSFKVPTYKIASWSITSKLGRRNGILPLRQKWKGEGDYGGPCLINTRETLIYGRGNFGGFVS